MRYRTGKTRSYTSKKKKKDTKLTTKNSANAFQTKPQPTQQNAAYKMTNIHLMSGMSYSISTTMNTFINHIIYPGQISPSKVYLYYKRPK